MDNDRIRIELVLSRRQLKGVLALALLGGLAYAVGSETLSLVASYPSPVGIYRKLFSTDQTILARDGGNVGIHTANPTYTLDVTGTFGLHDGTQGSGKALTSDSNGAASWRSLKSQNFTATNAAVFAGVTKFTCPVSAPVVFSCHTWLMEGSNVKGLCGINISGSDCFLGGCDAAPVGMQWSSQIVCGGF